MGSLLSASVLLMLLQMLLSWAQAAASGSIMTALPWLLPLMHLLVIHLWQLLRSIYNIFALQFLRQLN
jgi:hypothetical protein